MFCDNCGRQLTGREKFCPGCGKPLPGAGGNKKKKQHQFLFWGFYLQAVQPGSWADTF